jgi:hypothetical protein
MLYISEGLLNRDEFLWSFSTYNVEKCKVKTL